MPSSGSPNLTFNFHYLNIAALVNLLKETTPLSPKFLYFASKDSSSQARARE
jgi:hypothetical protein